MADERPVPFDSRGDLWGAVKDGIVFSQDLSPSLKFKPTELKRFGGTGDLEPPVRAVSPPPSELGWEPGSRQRGQRRVGAGTAKATKETQTTLTGADIDRYEAYALHRKRRRDAAKKLMSLLLKFQMQTISAELSDGDSDKENTAP